MRKAAQPTKKKANINAARCIDRIEWAASGIKDEIEHGGAYVMDKYGRPAEDESGRRIFVRSVNPIKIRAYRTYAEVQLKLLRKVLPDAVVKVTENPGGGQAEEELLKRIANELPD
jgi:hypothetical protein